MVDPPASPSFRDVRRLSVKQIRRSGKKLTSSATPTSFRGLGIDAELSRGLRAAGRPASVKSRATTPEAGDAAVSSRARENEWRSENKKVEAKYLLYRSAKDVWGVISNTF